MRHIEEGDRVAMPIKYAEGIAPKRHLGTVIAVGKKGVQVRFDDAKRPALWLTMQQLEVLERARPDTSARVTAEPHPMKAVVALVPPPPPQPTELRREEIQQRVTSTMSSLDAWRSMGRDLLNEATEALHFAEVEAANADEDLRLAKEASEAAHRRCLELRAHRDQITKVVSDGS